MLSETDEKEIAEIVKAAVADGCGHTHHAARLFSRIEAVGEGNIERGIESVGKSIDFINKVRRWGEKAGGDIALWTLKWTIRAILTAAAVGVAVGVWIKYGAGK